MPKDIFYIAKEMCSECWNQLSKTIERIENNNIDNIKDLLFYQYDNKNQIKPIAKKAISIIKCNNKFYALFSKQDLVKQKQTFFNNINPDHITDVLTFSKTFEENNAAINQITPLKNITYSLPSDTNSSQQLVHHKSSKPKLHRWLWIILIILLLILLAGGGGIGYEIYRISSRTNIGNSYITDDDSIVDTEDLDTKEPGHDDKDDVDKENDKNQEINISQYSFDFTKNSSNLIEVDVLELDFIKTKLVALPDVSVALQVLLEDDSLRIVLEQEAELSAQKNFLVNLQLDASEVTGYTGQAVLRLEVKVKPKEIDISQYSFDFAKNISNLIEVDALELNLIKAKLVALPDVSPALQVLLQDDSLRIVLEQEAGLSSEKNLLVNLQLDASEVVGHTGQAVLRLEVKVKPEEIEGVINIKGIVNVYKGVNNTYETADFRKHFEPLLKLYEKSVKFKVQAWSGNLPKLTGGIEVPQMQKDILTEALNKRFVPDFERVNIIHNGDVQNLEIYWIFTKQNQKNKVLNLSPYASGQVFAKSHFQENFKYNLKIKYTNKNI